MTKKNNIRINQLPYKKERILFVFIRKINIQSRLILSFAFLCVLPLIFISFLAYNKSSTAIETKINIYSAQIMNQVGNNLNIKNTSITNALSEIINNPAVVPIVTDYESYNDTQKRESKSLINSIFMTKFQTADTIIATQFMKKLSSSKSFSLDIATQEDSSTLEPAIKLALDSKSSHPESNYFLTPIFLNLSSNISARPDHYIFVSSIFNDLMDETDTSIIGVLIKESDYSKLYSNVNLGKDADLFIVNSMGKVVSSRDPEKFTIGESFSDPTLIEKITQSINNNNSNFTLNLSNQKRLVTYSQISGTDWFMVLTVPFTYVTADSTALGINIALIATVIALFALLISFIITKSIIKPLNKLGSVLAESAKGNLSVFVDERGKDEITQLSIQFNLMIKSINTLIKQVGTSSENVLNDAIKISGLSTTLLKSSEEISLTVQQVAEGAANQALDSTDCVNQMNVLSSSVTLVNDNMSSIANVVNDTSKLSTDVRKIMDLLNTKTIESKNVSTKITADINDLNDEMKKIETIVNAIVGLTDQTNLLSLNATIEAARAGEAGKGFAVVANEIKKLSDQSKHASTTISSILDSIRVKTSETVNAASNADSIFKEQMDSVILADDKINFILGFMEEITNKIYVMNDSVTHIILTKNKTTESIENISAVSEQNSAIVQEVASNTYEQAESSRELMSLASNLNDMTEILNKAISNFKV